MKARFRENGIGHARSFQVCVGRVTVCKPIKRTRLYECAAWHQDIEIEAGTTADLWLTLRNYDPYGECEWVEDSGHAAAGYRLAGVKGSSNFTSRIGAHYGEPKLDQGRGEPDSFGVWMYATDAARLLCQNDERHADRELDTVIEPGVRISVSTYVIQPTKYCPEERWHKSFHFDLSQLQDEIEDAYQELSKEEHDARN